MNMPGMTMNGMSMAGHGSEPPPAGSTTCSPTWAQPSSDGASIFVACNGTSDIAEIDVDGWRLRRRLPARPGVYNLAVTRDDRLLTTNRRDQSISIVDLKTGAELKRLPTRRRVVHGVVVSADGKYAFVSVEGIGRGARHRGSHRPRHADHRRLRRCGATGGRD
jgi:DNA-binding beta-propeller fold protein YncE